MQENWLILIYRFLLYPALFLFLRLFSFTHPKLERYFSVRRGQFWRKHQAPARPIWLHCSSGELEYAKPLIRQLKSRGDNVFVSYFSPSVEGALKKDPNIDLYLPAPYDFASHMQDFIQWLNPQSLYVARTDVWPEMLYQCHLAKVPAFLFSATLSDNNKKIHNALTRKIFHTLFSWLDHIYCVDQEDAKNFLQKLEVPHVSVTGDTRYLQCLYRLNNLQSEIAKPEKPFIVFGSTWPKDEEVILPVLKDILKLGYQCILVPHEVKTAQFYDLLRNLNQAHIDFQLYSKSEKPLERDVVVVDVVGILAILYKNCDLAFVGGSFKGSVHSVMEPLVAGSAVIVGPHHHNNREALEFKNIYHESLPIVREVHDSKELLQAVRDYGNSSSKTRRDFIRQEIQKHADMAAKGLQEILDRQN
tara:strand:- start:7203 stop:8453 length:1251 start_codon:yes stop_codon:yes gene_type:complete